MTFKTGMGSAYSGNIRARSPKLIRVSPYRAVGNKLCWQATMPVGPDNQLYGFGHTPAHAIAMLASSHAYWRAAK